MQNLNGRQPIIFQYANECACVGRGYEGYKRYEGYKEYEGYKYLGKFLISIDNARNWFAIYDILTISNNSHIMNKGQFKVYVDLEFTQTQKRIWLSWPLSVSSLFPHLQI